MPDQPLVLLFEPKGGRHQHTGQKSHELFRSKLLPTERAAYLKRIEAGEILRIDAELGASKGATVWTDGDWQAKPRRKADRPRLRESGHHGAHANRGTTCATARARADSTDRSRAGQPV